MEQTVSKLIDSRKVRFSNAVWFDDVPNHRILIVGAGGAGSWLTLYLSRIGYTIDLWDFDKIEIQNIGGQTFGIQELNNFKVHAVKNLTKNLGCNNMLQPFTTNFGLQSTLHNSTDIFITAVDTVSGRLDVFKRFLDSNMENKLYIEPRLSAEMFQIYIFTQDITSEQISTYKGNLNALNDLPEDACTFRQTSHIASMLGSVITTIITNWSSNLQLGVEIKTIPNYIEFNGNLLLLTVE